MSVLMIAVFISSMNIGAYTFDDMVRDIVPGRKGGEAMKEVARLIEKTSVQVRSDRETEKFRKDLMKSLERFDFMKIYNSRYCTDYEDGYRGVTFQGCNRDDHYSVNLVTSDEDRCEVSRIWDFRTRYSMKKNDRCITGGRSFIMSINSLTATKRYSHRNGLAFVDGLFRVIDPDNLRLLKAPECGLFTNLEGDARGVVNAFHKSFPGVSGFFERYAEIRSLLSVEKHAGVKYTRVDVRYGYRLDNLKEDFPRLAKSIRKIRDLYKIKLTFKNGAGHTYCIIVFDSRDDVLSMSFYTRRGRFVPWDGAGKPVLGEAVSPAAVRNIAFYAVMDMVHDVHGLKFTTNNVIIRVKWNESSARGHLKIRMEDIPRTAISGSYYNIIPAWVIDLFIPTNMEQLIYDFSTVMVQADEGKGSYVSFNWDARDPNNVMLEFNATSEFIDNYFIRYGLRVWSKKMMADDSFTVEAVKLTAKLLKVFKTDLDSLKL
ncbi:MAG: hypothetical protein JW807_02435 [Spirochaetes bacterium]|nr:hypothetical protein [Spirochaetota bacterium]